MKKKQTKLEKHWKEHDVSPVMMGMSRKSMKQEIRELRKQQGIRMLNAVFEHGITKDELKEHNS